MVKIKKYITFTQETTVLLLIKKIKKKNKKNKKKEQQNLSIIFLYHSLRLSLREIMTV